MIEIISQISTHLPDCKILVATQSNQAANLIATRLITDMPKIGNELLRLVCNAALDREDLPIELHKFSASVQHPNVPRMDDDSIYDDIPKDIRRNCNLSFLKGFKIIVGTCVGLGVLFNR